MTTIPRNPTRRTPIQSRARHSHDAILEATARILESAYASGEGGRELPSTNRIAKVAGVSVGTLYQYFDSREAILRALCRRHSDEMTTLLLAHAGPMMAAPPAEAVPAFVDAMAAAHAVAPRLHLALVRELLADGGELLAEVQDPSRSLVLGCSSSTRPSSAPRTSPPRRSSSPTRSRPPSTASSSTIRRACRTAPGARSWSTSSCATSCPSTSSQGS